MKSGYGGAFFLKNDFDPTLLYLASSNSKTLNDCAAMAILGDYEFGILQKSTEKCFLGNYLASNYMTPYVEFNSAVGKKYDFKMGVSSDDLQNKYYKGFEGPGGGFTQWKNWIYSTPSDQTGWPFLVPCQYICLMVIFM